MFNSKKIIIILAALIITAGSFFFWISDKYTVPIIMYHRVDFTGGPPSNIVNPEIFAWQMDFLKKNGYKVISLNQLVDAITKEKPLPRNSVVITFDDGYKDNYTYAFKEFKKHEFLATIFISTEQIGQDDYLSWAQMREMIGHKISIGSHLLDQAYLPGIPKEEQWRQITQSKNVLDNGLNQKNLYLSYPSGGFNEDIKKMARESGYKGACTTNRGYDRFNKDVYELKRIRLSNKDNSPFILWAKLSGYYNLFRKAKNPY